MVGHVEGISTGHKIHEERRLFLWHGVDIGQSLVSLFPASGAETEGSADV